MSFCVRMHVHTCTRVHQTTCGVINMLNKDSWIDGEIRLPMHSAQCCELLCASFATCHFKGIQHVMSLTLHLPSLWRWCLIALWFLVARARSPGPCARAYRPTHCMTGSNWSSLASTLESHTHLCPQLVRFMESLDPQIQNCLQWQAGRFVPPLDAPLPLCPSPASTCVAAAGPQQWTQQVQLAVKGNQTGDRCPDLFPHGIVQNVTVALSDGPFFRAEHVPWNTTFVFAGNSLTRQVFRRLVAWIRQVWSSTAGGDWDL